MAGKRIKVSNRMLFTWLMLAGFILLFSPASLTSRFQFTFARIFHLPLNLGRSYTLSSRTYQQLDEVVSRREYDQLQNHLANLTEELVEKHKKIEHLTGVRGRLHSLEGARLVPADVITASLDSRCELIINRGANDGLAQGQYVLGDNSIIGVVLEVSPRTASVRLISDPESRLEIKVGKTERLMQGVGQNLAKIEMLNTKHKVEVGNKVYALKKPGFLDAAMITAKVAQCERDVDNPLIWAVTVEPACDLRNLKSVHVIIMNPQ